MSQFYEYNWPVVNTVDGIALDQRMYKDTPLILNGSYINNITNTAQLLKDFGIIPKLTFNSATSLEQEFNIIGYQNGVFIKETLNVNGTVGAVNTVNYFDSVEQIISNKTINDYNIKVGITSVGYFPIILLNTAKTNTSSISYALNIVAATANPATYQVFLSLKNNLGMGKYDDLTSLPNGNFAATVAAATASALIQYNSLASNLLIKIGTNASNSVLKAQFLQL